MTQAVFDELGDLIGIRCAVCSRVVLEVSLCDRCSSGDLLCSTCREVHAATSHGRAA